MAAARKKQRGPNTTAPLHPVQLPASSAASDRSPRVRWFFRALAILLVPLLVLSLLELGLRIFGVGHPTTFFLSAVVHGQKAFIENYRFGWSFFGAGAARTPRPMVLAADKPARTCRVFVFGESAAYGDPRPEFGLPRVLETLLRARFPGIKIEVINVAMTGINSHAVLSIARDCVSKQGDVWVFYMGNNEVVGPFGAGTVFGPQAPGLGLVRASLLLKSTRTGQLLAGALRRKGADAEPSEWQGMAMFLEHQVRQGDRRMPRVYDNFRRNLQDIVDLGIKHGVDVVLCSVASNLKDCSPFASLHKPDLGAAELARWETEWRKGVESEARGQQAEAIDAYRHCSELDSDFAELHFRWGRCALALGRQQEAREHFVMARDKDALRFRTDSNLNQLIGAVAELQEGRGVAFLDAIGLMERESRQGIPGEEVFYEHVHFNFAGNYVLARGIAEKASAGIRKKYGVESDAAGVWLSREECERRLAFTPWDQLKAARSLMLRINDPPFNSQVDAAERYARFEKQLEALLPAAQPAAVRSAIEVYRQAVAVNPDDWVLFRGLAELLSREQDFEGAERCYEQAAKLIPHDPLGWLELGLLRLQRNKPREAIEDFNRGLALRSDFVACLNARAVALSSLGEKDAALASYRQALQLKPRDAETLLNLSLALEQSGEKEQARARVTEALQMGSPRPEILIRLGKTAFLRGLNDAALTNLNQALRLNPTDAGTHVAMAGVLDSLGRRDEAKGHLAEAVRLNPGLAAARVGLGMVLLREGKAPEATIHLTEAVRLNSRSPEAHLNLGLALLKQNQSEQAAREFELVLQIDPSNKLARTYLEQAQASQPEPKAR